MTNKCPRCDSHSVIEIDCPECDGEGQIDNGSPEFCEICEGMGYSKGKWECFGCQYEWED